MDGIVIATTTQSQSEPVSDGNERLLHIPQSSKTVYSLILDTRGGGNVILYRDAVGEFYGPQLTGFSDVRFEFYDQ